MTEFLTSLEFGILDFIANNMHSPFLDMVMLFFSRLGDKGIIWIFLGFVLLLLPNRRSYGAQVLIALLLSLIVCNLILKNWVERIRPFEINTALHLLLPPPEDYSFPSGHTTSAFAAAAVLWKNHWKGRYPVLILSILIAFSRLYLYVHFPSDVLAGAVLGVLLGLAATAIYTVIWNKFHLKGGRDGCS